MSLEWGTTSNTVSWTYDTNWHHVVLYIPSGSTNANQALMYLDGVLQTLSAGSATLNLSSAEIALGGIPGAIGALAVYAAVDEVRIGTVTMTADQVTAEYNNQNAPGTFMSLGGEIAN